MLATSIDSIRSKFSVATRLHGRMPVTLKTPAAVVIREERESA